SFLINQVAERNQEGFDLPVIGAVHAPNLTAFLRSHRVNIKDGPADREAAVDAVRERKQDAVLIIKKTIGDDIASGQTATVELIFDQSRRPSDADARRLEALLGAYSQQLGALRLFARGVDPQIVRPINVDRIDVSTPSGRSATLLGMLTYMVLFAVLMGGLPVINDSTAGERERKSLEPLLTTPIARGQLVVEKILAAAFFMGLSAFLVITVLVLGLDYLPLEEIGMQNNFGFREASVALLVLLPFVLFGASFMSVVASFTKTYKEAQTYLGIVLIVPTMPIMFAGIADLKAELMMMMVPSLSQHFLLLSLIKAEPIDPLHALVSVASTLAVAMLAMSLAIRLYKREGLLG
ncbi:MAG: ABC transporter permease, partial [Myxococcota bacterium]